MHVAEQLKSENLQIQIDGQPATGDMLFPGAHKYDRFGFIVNEPFGSLGASLLIQAAIVQFYDACPERRDTEPMYPEIYMFHVGDRFGDHSSFDCWPPRKEVFIESSDPYNVMSAVLDRGITRLALPDCPGGDAAVLQDGPSTWADHAAAKNLFSTCFAYSPCGTTPKADVVLESDHNSFEANPASALNAAGLLQQYANEPDAFPRPGPTVRVDVDRWVEKVTTRVDEVEQGLASTLATQRLQWEEGRQVRRESFRRLDLNETFRLLTCLM